MSSNYRPKLREGVVFRQVEEDFVVYDPQSDRTVLLNLSAAALLELCDGSLNIADMVERVGSSLSLPAQQLQPIVTQALRDLEALLQSPLPSALSPQNEAL